jgi:SET domain-containing protein
MLTRFSKKIQVLLNKILEPSSIDSSEPIRVSNTPKVHRKRKEPHVIKRNGKELTIDQFTQETGVEYLPELKFQNEKIFQTIKDQCSYASKNEYIDSKRKWFGALYADQIRSHYVANVSIRWIDKTLEYGLFADEDFEPGDFIGEYTGVVKRHYPIIGKMSDYCFLYPTSRYFFGKHLIDAQTSGNEIRYANHSDDPNCEATGIFVDEMFHMILRSIAGIPAGAQITYDYGARYWKSRPRVANSIPRE